MSKRLHIPKIIEAKVLTRSRRRCCICFGLTKDDSEKKGQIAHLDRNSTNNSLENLAFLCLDHHDQYDSKTSQSKGLQIDEVKEYRNQLYSFIQNNYLDDSIIELGEPANLIKSKPIVEPTIPVNNTNFTNNFEELSGYFGMSDVEFQKEMDHIEQLLNRIITSSLSRVSIRILSTAIKIAKDTTINRRIIESEAGYDYLSREFSDEVTVLEHKGLLEFSQDYEYSNNIQFPRGDYQLWMTIKEIAKLNNVSIRDILEYPDLEYLLKPQ